MASEKIIQRCAILFTFCERLYAKVPPVSEASGAESPTRQRNRERIVRAAGGVIAHDPSASMTEIADAAGVVRRTLYSYFPTREDLIAAVAGLAGEAVLARMSRRSDGGMEPAGRLAAMTIDAWSVGQQLGGFLAVARFVDEPALMKGLEPVNDVFARLIAEGQRIGRFSDHLAPGVMARLLEAQAMTLHDERNGGRWDGSAADVAIAALVTVGIEVGVASKIVGDISAGDTRNGSI
jgi:TetR/AcrR family transcriptional regulator of autoinduction and epiphytic fitness